MKETIDLLRYDRVNLAINMVRFIPMNKLIVTVLASILISACGSEPGTTVGFVYSDDNVTIAVGNNPTALCKDGTYSYSQNCSSDTCSGNGGVAQWMDILSGCGR